MIETIFGSINKEKVLIFLIAREEGYSREIARFFDTDLTPIQKQLEKLEIGGVLYSKMVGRTRVFMFNPRHPFLAELKNLLDKVLQFYPDEIRDKLLLNRRRPRRQGKPI
jgi:hypothetical protein